MSGNAREVHSAGVGGMKLAPIFISIPLMISANAVAAQSCAPAAGADRMAILDALRAPVSASLRADVEFVVERPRICGDWAFALTTPQLRGGGEPRWTGTPCDGDTSHLAGGLMRRDSGVWRLLEHALCPSDVAWADWPDRYGAPAALFEE